MQDYDITIIGGGLVGNALVAALQPLGLRVAQIEAKVPQPINVPESQLDKRAIALSYVSCCILNHLKLWPHVAEHATAIREVHVSERGRLGVTRINANEHRLPALGYVVPIVQLAAQLQQAQLNSGVEILCPAQLTNLQQQEDGVQLEIAKQDGEVFTINSKLVIAADGVNSFTRKLLGIEVEESDYGQHAIVANVALQRSHNNIAYERFTSEGVLAMLPNGDNVSTMVWTADSAALQPMMELDDKQLLLQLKQKFGYRLGRFVGLGSRQSYPLKQSIPKQQQQGRVLLLGNAAHNLHPVAAQGFNLILRDIAELVELMQQHDLSASLFQNYEDKREQDQSRTIKMTDGLVRLFGMRYLSTARGLGLLALDNMPITKRWFARRSIGFQSDLPKMALQNPL